jgi:uncharacterized protein (UPF0147 family)
MSLKVKLQESVNEVITALENLKNDESVPKNIKAKIDDIVAGLRDDSDVSSKVGKSLHVLDEISEDLNIPAFIRTQVWNVSSMLEKLNH